MLGKEVAISDSESMNPYYFFIDDCLRISILVTCSVANLSSKIIVTDKSYAGYDIFGLPFVQKLMPVTYFRFMLIFHFRVQSKIKLFSVIEAISVFLLDQF